MNVIFAHGKESGPWGTKIKHLAGIARDLGCEVHSPDYRGVMDPDERVRMLLEIDEVEPPLMLVGSSMGGYVSAVAAHTLHPAGLFLMAPALYIPIYQVQDHPALPCPVAIVHGWRDDIIPVAHSIRYAQTHCADLHIIDSDHGLNDSLDQVGSLFRSFLGRAMEE